MRDEKPYARFVFTHIGYFLFLSINTYVLNTEDPRCISFRGCERKMIKPHLNLASNPAVVSETRC